MDENQILAHGAVRNCATGPLKFDCHSGIDQQSTEMADLTSAGAQQESRAQAKKSTGSDEMEQKPKHTGRPRVRSLRKLKAHSQKKFSPLSMQYPGPQFRTRQHKTVVTTAGRSDISAANSCKRHQQNRANLAKRCDQESFWLCSILGRNATARGHTVMPGRVSRRRIQRPGQLGSRVTFFRVLFGTFNRRGRPLDRG